MTATDLDALATRTSGQRWQECSVAYALRTLPEGPAEALRRALGNDVVQHTEISNALRDYGIRISGPSIGRHRLGACKCEATA
jgi:hypothetical protein